MPKEILNNTSKDLLYAEMQEDRRNAAITSGPLVNKIVTVKTRNLTITMTGSSLEKH